MIVSRRVRLACAGVVLAVATAGCSLGVADDPAPAAGEVLDLRRPFDMPAGWKEWGWPDELKASYALPPRQGWANRSNALSHEDLQHITWWGPMTPDGMARHVVAYEQAGYSGSAYQNEQLESGLEPRAFLSREFRPVHVAGTTEAAILERTWDAADPGRPPLDEEARRARQDARPARHMRERQLRIITKEGKLLVFLVRGPDADFRPEGVMSQIFDSVRLHD